MKYVSYPTGSDISKSCLSKAIVCVTHATIDSQGDISVLSQEDVSQLCSGTSCVATTQCNSLYMLTKSQTMLAWRNACCLVDFSTSMPSTLPLYASTSLQHVHKIVLSHRATEEVDTVSGTFLIMV